MGRARASRGGGPGGALARMVNASGQAPRRPWGPFRRAQRKAGGPVKLDKHNVVADKLDYAKGKRPPVDCILCAVAQDDPRVDNLRVYRHDSWFITLNLYPYNPGHLMLVPLTHHTDVRQLSESEVLELHRLQVLALQVLEREYRPGGFNVGYNLGPASGASIEHLHLQIVPRYRSEVGFFDILSDSRVIVEAPGVTRERLTRAFAEEAPRFFAAQGPVPARAGRD
jgi:ATP adenylyltransferase